MTHKNFLSLLDLSPDTLRGLITRGVELKAIRKSGTLHEPLKNQVLAMIFEKSSTRTRMSFEAGMVQLGGTAIFLSPRDTQLGRGEPIEDSARVLSRMADAIMIRTFEHEKIERFAAYSQVPVINALTDLYHPCQLLADMQTWFEHRGEIQGKTVAWIGDGNNMCHSYINAMTRTARFCKRQEPAPSSSASPWMQPPMPTWWSRTSGPAWARKKNRHYGKRLLPVTRLITIS